MTSQKVKALMKTRLSLWIFFALLGVASFVVSGCYTQVGVTREDGQDEQYAAQGGQNADSAQTDAEEDNGYTYNDDNWDNRPHVGYQYYYPSYYNDNIWPSYAFGAAYANPWGYNNFYGYGSYYNSYDPWWCGSPYLGYSNYWGYGSYYSYYPYAYSPYYYSYRARNVKHGDRDFGTTRGGEGGSTVNTGTRVAPNDRIDGSGTLPTGMRSATGGSSTRGAATAPAVSAPTRSGSTRGIAPGNPSGSNRGNAGNVRGSSSRTGNSRVYRQRGGAAQGSADERGTSAPTYAPPSRDGGSQGGSSTRGASPSYSPPPSSAPAPSSGRGSAPSNSGSSRGGSTRGGRPN